MSACYRCGAEGPLFGNLGLCGPCRELDAKRRIASYRNHPSQLPPLKKRERRKRQFVVIDLRQPDDVDLGVRNGGTCHECRECEPQG